MVEFSAKSWHRRVYDYAWGGYNLYPRISLCRYFWRVVVATLYMSILWFFRNITGVVGHHKLSDLQEEMVVITLIATGPSIMVGIVGWALLTPLTNQIVAVLFFLIVSIGSPILVGASYYLKRSHSFPTPNLLVEFVKAKKQRLCPIITWKDEVESK
mgnify:FL=1